MSAFQSIMAKKVLPNSLWKEIATIVVYIQNRYPSIRGKTPFEKCNNKPSNILNSKVFIYWAFILILNITNRFTMDL